MLTGTEKHRKAKLPRATLKEKIEVLNFICGPPKKSQLEALAHFRDQKRFAISQATLSNWTLKEKQLREEFIENPNLEDYRKKPVLKHPEVTKAVEKYVEKAFEEGQTITDNMIKQIFVKYLKEYGYSESDFKISGGMLHSFKKRNFISGGKIVEAPKRRRSSNGTAISAASTNDERSKALGGASRSPTTTSSSSPFATPDQPGYATNNKPSHSIAGSSSFPGSDQDLDINFDEIFSNPIVGFNTRLIHSDDSFPNMPSALGYQQVGGIDSLLGASASVGSTANVGSINVGIPPMTLPPAQPGNISGPNGSSKPLDGPSHSFATPLFGNFRQPVQQTQLLRRNHVNQTLLRPTGPEGISSTQAQVQKKQGEDQDLPQQSQSQSQSQQDQPQLGLNASRFSQPSVAVMTRNTSVLGSIDGKDENKDIAVQTRNGLPYYPTYQSPMQYRSNDYQRHQRPYVLENFAYSKSSHPNSEKVEKILETITDGYVTIYNSGTSAIMGILSYLNPPMVCINNSGYQGTHEVIKLLSKLTGLQKKGLEEIDQLVPRSVVLLETPMNPEGYLLDIAKFARQAHEKQAFMLVDSTLAPPPLQFPFTHGADYIVYSAVKYLAGVSDLSAGFVVSRHKNEKLGMHNERFALGTNIANFDSFLLLRSLRTYKMRILTQCSNTKKVVHYMRKHLKKYEDVVTKLHHSSLQTNNDCFKKQLNSYYNPVFAVEFKYRQLAETVLTRFNFLSNNPNLEGGETLVELTFKNPNFRETQSDDENRSNLLRFSIGCEDYADIIRDIDQAIMSVIKPITLPPPQ
ncbi:hypothetical protein FOA43_002588 [Brettanomyces nanus]|uniref:HTH CENPB-type domain-containing protein n=1 Tax=Eeniella nana TaxID=13502 RepID=A0A875S2Q7_EENNA|nr:uncharacterized protein FOA43_002588 [Brettanomyces nanus]QPG75238.1 hypothetical protein FOA43_002588 [Brettanomyces nanus]